MIIQFFRSKKLPKILGIRQIHEKTAKFYNFWQFFRLIFFQIYQIVKHKKWICFYFGKNKRVIIEIFRSKKLPKILEIRQIREETTSFTIFLFFFFKFTRLLSMKNYYVYISEKINQWFFKFSEAKNSKKSLKFDKFAKKLRVLQFCRLIFFWNLPNC